MRHVLIVLLTLFSPFALASSVLKDARNTAEYHVLFDIGARGKADIVNGYGAYVQLYINSGHQWIRYCENFEGKGASGRPNPKRDRFKLLPFGQIDATSFRCRDFTPGQLAEGQPLIRLGERHFFAMKSSHWSETDGGEILFQFAKKIPLLGSPTYRTLRIRALRTGPDFEYSVETIVPRVGILPTHYFDFEVSASGLGLPNGIISLTIDPKEQTEKSLDLDGLEGAIQVRGKYKDIARTPSPLSEPLN